MTPAQRAHRDKLAEEYGKYNTQFDDEFTNDKRAYSAGYDAAHAEAERLVKAIEDYRCPYCANEKTTYPHCLEYKACVVLKAWRRTKSTMHPMYTNNSGGGAGGGNEDSPGYNPNKKSRKK